jgi:AraC family transcriptional regulator, transcriptional activator of pobA
MKPIIPVYDIAAISEFKKEDIFVSRFAPYSNTHQHLHYPHRHSFFHILLFTKGSGKHTIDFCSFRVQPFQIYFMIPGQVHSWNFEGDVDGYVINFSNQFFQSFLLKPDYIEAFPFFCGVVEQSVIQISSQYHKPIEDIFEEILHEANENKKYGSDLVKVLLLKIFILISRFTDEKVESRSSSYNYTLLKNFQQLLEKNFLKLRLPKEYAELLYITPHHLNALCNDLLGISTGEVIRNRVLLEAKRLLINLDLPVSEIAFLLNFNDNSYFSKFFKKYSGITPEEFRKSAMEHS